MMKWQSDSKEEVVFGPVKWITETYPIKGVDKMFAYLEVPNGVHLLAQYEGRFAVIKQYRPAIGDYVFELPGGGIETGEEILEAAYRELKEEIGLIAERGLILGSCRPSLAFSNEVTWIVYAEGNHLGEQSLEWDEDIQVYWMTLLELKTALLNGQIQQASAFAAIWLLEQRETLNMG